MAGGRSSKVKTQPEVVEPAARVLRRFRVVFNAMRGHFREVEKKAGLAGAQVWALSVVRDRPGIGVGGLAREMDIHQSTASNLLRSLLAGGLVAADREGADRRAVQLHISAKGLKVLDKVPGPFEGVLPNALRQLDARTLASLDRQLGKLIDHIGGDPDAATVPLGQRDPG
ncbi:MULTISPECIES: MarR family winged helix-turn-helix transcriptional regulator [Ramlibacter]|uniref:Winged helix-turn-helix transcriptional regulator n=1 Tax=Ramlibacter aquaticus TaxID=2780094 RepID=A0ABR9SJD1_9BURK|nr:MULTISPECIES: MarR family winged helix-turn-helix transcriptional regulator [Ramlibacter]MBE7942476.1 winged helix-turn-helix transcriptional regulator [Ramlibacter aquaticus]